MPAKVIAPEGQKWCARGNHFVDVNDFPKSRRYKDGKSHTCKPCCRKRDKERDYYRKNHGISRSEFDQMVVDQNGRCASCKDELKRPHLDHCHRTGQLRSVLCHQCNVALGYLKDDPVRIMALLEYIGKWT